MDRPPSFQFYPADWLNDIKLQACSDAAQGLLMKLMCLMHQSDEYGFLVINGTIPGHQTVAKLTRNSPRKFTRSIHELVQNGVLKIDDRGAFYCQRMVKDEALRLKRKEAGAKGGNPVLLNQQDNQGANQKTTPSSSSSSSSSDDGKTIIIKNPPKPPKGGGAAIADELVTLYFERVRKRGARGRAVKAILTRFKAGIPETDLRTAIINCGEFHRAAGTEDKHVMLAETFFTSGWEDARWWPEVTAPEPRAGPRGESAQAASDRRTEFWQEMERKHPEGFGHDPKGD